MNHSKRAQRLVALLREDWLGDINSIRIQGCSPRVAKHLMSVATIVRKYGQGHVVCLYNFRPQLRIELEQDLETIVLPSTKLYP
jgi:hypothetical protein